MAETNRKLHDALDPREAAKRHRDKLLILGVAALFILTTYFEIRLSNLSNRLPFVNSIFFFGLINFNIVLLMVLAFLVLRNMGKLFLERRRRIMGSRLKTKLVLAFLSFTIIPTVILFLISSLYINSSFDKWFSIKVQNTLQATLDITQIYYKNTNRIAQHMASQFAVELRERYGVAHFNGTALKKYVLRNIELPTVDGIEVYTDPLDERVLAVNGPDAEHSLPRLPLDILNKAFSGETVSLVQHMAGTDLIRAVAPVMDRRSGKVYGAVAVTFIIPVSIVNKVDEISSVFQDYRDVNPLKYPMKSTYFIILIMMTLLIIFVSIWIGLYLARELTVPLERLVTATQRIREGNLDFEVINPGDDEIATLTGSFNNMTAELKRHRVELEATNRALAEKSAYVEAILNNVAAGVLSVSATGVIVTVNESAGRLLGQSADQLVGRKINEAFDATAFPLPGLFAQAVARLKEGGDGTLRPVQKQFTHGNEEAFFELMVTASPFGGGVVFVVDDMSHLSKGQREAAWREVARRIAHEIKNPLTPIKLSAQRLQKKFASHHTAEAAVFRECTDTIIKGVDELRDMVNEFSQFARFPQSNPTPQNINEALRETIVLYEEAHRSIAFVFTPETRLPLIDLDRDQIKRVMINLLDNAVAALENGIGAKMNLPKKITLRTHYNEMLRIAAVELEDNGPGMTDAVRGRLFEPYFSTKTSGTGLGLAIVKRIVSDHQGFIRVQSAPGEGTKFTIELPINLLDNEYIRGKEIGQLGAQTGFPPIIGNV